MEPANTCMTDDVLWGSTDENVKADDILLRHLVCHDVLTLYIKHVLQTLYSHTQYYIPPFVKVFKRNL